MLTCIGGCKTHYKPLPGSLPQSSNTHIQTSPWKERRHTLLQIRKQTHVSINPHTKKTSINPQQTLSLEEKACKTHTDTNAHKDTLSTNPQHFYTSFNKPHLPINPHTNTRAHTYKHDTHTLTSGTWDTKHKHTSTNPHHQQTHSLLSREMGDETLTPIQTKSHAYKSAYRHQHLQIRKQINTHSLLGG